MVENTKYRNDQLKICFELLNKCDNSFFMGDFNFDPSWEEEKVIDYKSYKDSFSEWKNSKNLSDADGYTRPKQ